MITTPMFVTVHDATMRMGAIRARLASDPDRVWVATPEERISAFRARITRDLGPRPAGAEAFVVALLHHAGTRLN